MATIEGIISRADSARPNTFSNDQKITWLAILDQMVYRDIISKTVGSDAAYSAPEQLHDTLLIEKPFDEIYVLWLFAQMDFYQGETNRYNIDLTAFNDLYDNFNDNYIDSHEMQKMPKISW